MEKQLIPQLRFPVFSNKWVSKKLGDIATFSKGKGISKSDIIEDGKNECIRYGELYTTYNEVINSISSRTNIELADSIISEENDVIIPSSGETQLDIATASCVLKNGVILGGDLNIIKSNINGVFLSYLLNNSKKKDIAKLAQGNAVVHLYNKQLATLSLKLPTSEEQQKIASFLTDVDDKITKLTKKKDLLEQYKKGIMQKIFNQELRFKPDVIARNEAISQKEANFPEWEEKKITTFAKTTIGLVTSMTKHYVHKDIGVPLIRNSDIMGNKIRMEKLIYLDKVFSETHNNRRLKFNDVVTVHTGDIGISSVIDKKLDGCHGFATLNTRIKNIKEVLPSYLSWYFNSERGIRYALSMATGDGRSNYNLKDFNKAIVPIPHIKEQTKIANFLSDIDVKIEALNTKIENSKTFKKGLLQQMFV
ncbi:restriction endonuclease subunit S [Aquimarina sp. 2-A2]|uniref:restriction endonuclease subunit S n=1 Tax=Aquimarina sp. 2-A2 TaxID=3382644 RepID=UPI00387EFE76